MKKYIEWIITHRKIILFLCAIIMIIGIISYYFIPKKENPDTTIPIAMITTAYPGASSVEVEENVTILIENQIASMEYINVIKSHSMEGYSVVIAEFNNDCDWQNTKNDLNTRVSKVQKDLPQICQESDVKVDVTDTADFIISLSGDSISKNEMLLYANDIKTSLEKIDGISKIEIEGYNGKQVNVVLDAKKLSMYNISSEQVVDLISAQNVSIPSGSIKYEQNKINVAANTEMHSIEDLENIIVYSDIINRVVVKLCDIAEIEIVDTSKAMFEQDGYRAILVCGYFDNNQNAVLIGQDVRDEIELIKQDMPQQLIFHEVLFSPQDVNESIKSFMLSLIQSIVLIVIVVMVGVRFKNGLIISIVLPFSILFTFVIMYMIEIELQFISIAALIISLGILVDNAVVVSDCIQRNLDDGMIKNEAITIALKDIAVPVINSSITTIIAFGTLYFFSGSVGAIAETIPTVVIAALSASYIGAMVIIPILAYMIFSPMKKNRKHREGLIKGGFLKVLDLGLKRKGITVLLSFVTLGVAMILSMQLGLSFFPNSDKEVIYIDIECEKNYIKNTEQVVKQVYEVLDRFETVENYTSGIGKPVPRFFMTLPYNYDADNYAQIMIQLDLSEDEKYNNNESVINSLQRQLDSTINGAKCTVNSLEYAYPSDAKVEIMLQGQDIELLKQTAKEVQTALLEMDSTCNIRDDIKDNEKEYLIEINDQEASGILKYDIAKQINTALMGYTTSTVTFDNNTMDVVVKVDINDIDDLKTLPIVSSVDNEQVLLGDIADIELVDMESAINRYNGQRYVLVLVDAKDGYSSFDVQKEFEEKHRSDVVPGEVEIIYQGEIANMNKFLKDAGLITGCALLLIYIVLLIQFKCFKRALIILSSIPLSMIGCFLGLYIFKVNIQAMAILGMIALFGVVVNNGIILIEHMDNLVGSGISVEGACKGAVSIRFRPIVISTVTTCAGLIPLIYSKDPMSAPMAMVLFFGLLLSTVLTMIVVPVMYSIVEK